MTDLQKLENVLTEIGCKYELHESIKENGKETETDYYDGEVTYDTIIELDNGIGFYNFNCKFYFLSGKFQGHGCWE